MRIAHCLALLLTASLAPACATEDTDPLTDETMEQEFRCPTCADGRDGAGFNTNGLEGVIIKGFRPNGEENDGVTLLSVVANRDGIPGIPIYDITADAGVLYGTDQFGNHYSGIDFEGSVWTFELGMEAFIDPPSEDPEEVVQWVMKAKTFISDGDRSRYVFTEGPTEELAEHFKCAMDPETGEFSAILYNDLGVEDSGVLTQDDGTIYLGCTSGAIGKAGMWGYAKHAVGLDMHQAAVRMIRADYCGDGDSYTVSGTRLQMQDELGIKAFVDFSEMTEAMWTKDGAVCLKEPRRPEHPYDSVLCKGQTLPMCEPNTDLNDWGAVLWTKNLPQLNP